MQKLPPGTVEATPVDAVTALPLDRSARVDDNTPLLLRGNVNVSLKRSHFVTKPTNFSRR